MSDVQTTQQQQKPKPPLEVFRGDLTKMEREFSMALPPHIPVERFMRVVMTAVQSSMAANFTNLLECNRRSLWQACMKAAQDGLLPDGREGAVIKYMDDAQWVPMIAGLRKKARNSGEISTWDAHCVYKNDYFMLKLGDSPSIDHTYNLADDRGELIGAYSVAVLKDGSKSYEVMSLKEIHAIRDRSSAWKAFKANRIKSTPWASDEAEMARKTVAKRHAKQLPASSDLDDLIRRDDHLYDGEPEALPAAGGLTALPSRPQGKGALDQFAAQIEHKPEVEMEQVGTDEGEKVDAETGEVTTAQEQAAAGETNGEKAAPEPATTAGSPEASPAFLAGREARRKGQAARAVPGQYRDSPQATQDWRDGWQAEDRDFHAGKTNA